METQFTQKEINSATGVIKRRRTNFEKKIRRKLPLFAEQVIAEYKDQNPIEHLENREKWHKRTKEQNKEWRIKDRELILNCRQEVFELCADREEFFKVLRRAVKIYRGTYKSHRWMGLRDKLKKRLQRISAAADLVLAWLEQETAPVSHWDIWRKRGDGLTPKQIADALHELSSRELACLVGSSYSKNDEGLPMPCATWAIPRNT